MIEPENEKKLKLIAATVRKDVVRMTGLARAGSVASSLSVVDILTFLYWSEMHVFPEDPGNPLRDRFILSKGHGCPALYSILAHRGFFSRDELWNYCKLGAMLQGNPESGHTPGIDASSGSCGTGLGIAAGMALSLMNMEGNPRVYCLSGDGELQEGVVWESVLFAAHYGLGNLVLVIDENGFQMDGEVEDIMSLRPLDAKFSSFGWNVFRADGHDYSSLAEAFSKASGKDSSPSVLICRTVFGKGVSFIEKAGKSGNEVILSRGKVDSALMEISEATERQGDVNGEE